MTYYITGLSCERLKIIVVPTMTVTDEECASAVQAILKSRGLFVAVRTEEG